MTELIIDGANLILAAILVLWCGNELTKRFAFLRKYSIPIAVTGGLIGSALIAIIGVLGGPAIIFTSSMRDTLLLVFFSTIGLSAKLSSLKSGGKALGVLVVCAGVFLFFQNVVGVMLAKIMGANPTIGLFAGSISLAGGHGTAIAWGAELKSMGLENAEGIGIAFATFGLVAGSLIGGPVSEMLIKKNKLCPRSTDAGHMITEDKQAPLKPSTLNQTLQVLMILALCVSLGAVVNGWLAKHNLKLPGFLTAMLVGIVITNLADIRKKPLRQNDFDRVGEVSLQLFLAMSLVSMDLLSLAGAFGGIFIVICIQMLAITLFSVFIIFRLMGKDYDAAVISGGFCGLGMGATPVAIANMSAITSKYGPSFKAFLVIPLVGAFFIDLMNAVIIKFFLSLPFMQM